MRLLPLLFGLFFIAVGLVAIFDGDLWDSWQWLLAAAVAVLGISGLASAVLQRGEPADQQL